MPIDYTHPKRINYEHPRRRRGQPDTSTPNTARTQPSPPTPSSPQTPSVTPRGPASGSPNLVSCVCGTTVDRNLVAQCTNCGYDLWSLDRTSGSSNTNSPATVVPRRPIGTYLPEAIPPELGTNFVSVMQSYSDQMRARLNAALELEGSAVDTQWREVAARILDVHHWDATALTLETLMINIMKMKIQEWAARGGMADLDDIGWTHVCEFVKQIDTVAGPGDRDWTTGPIEMQHREAIPLEFDYLESVKRIIAMTADVETTGQEVFIKLANVFNGHIEDFARRNNADMEILSSDITDAITSRQGWLPEWAFVWPTYFGELGVYAYNDWVNNSHKIEWHIAKIIIDGAQD